MQRDIWTYEIDVTEPMDVSGFHVEAIDGRIGKVDEATYEVGSSYLVVDTGPWIFGRKVVIPAGTITQLDIPNELIGLNLTKDQIKDSPEFKPDTDEYRTGTYRSDLGRYYERSLVTPLGKERSSPAMPGRFALRRRHGAASCCKP